MIPVRIEPELYKMAPHTSTNILIFSSHSRKMKTMCLAKSLLEFVILLPIMVGVPLARASKLVMRGPYASLKFNKRKCMSLVPKEFLDRN